MNTAEYFKEMVGDHIPNKVILNGTNFSMPWEEFLILVGTTKFDPKLGIEYVFDERLAILGDGWWFEMDSWDYGGETCYGFIYCEPPKIVTETIPLTLKDIGVLNY